CLHRMRGDGRATSHEPIPRAPLNTEIEASPTVPPQEADHHVGGSLDPDGRSGRLRPCTSGRSTISASSAIPWNRLSLHGLLGVEPRRAKTASAGPRGARDVDGHRAYHLRQDETKKKGEAGV